MLSDDSLRSITCTGCQRQAREDNRCRFDSQDGLRPCDGYQSCCTSDANFFVRESAFRADEDGHIAVRSREIPDVRIVSRVRHIDGIGSPDGGLNNVAERLERLNVQKYWAATLFAGANCCGSKLVDSCFAWRRDRSFAVHQLEAMGADFREFFDHPLQPISFGWRNGYGDLRPGRCSGVGPIDDFAGQITPRD